MDAAVGIDEELLAQLAALAAEQVEASGLRLMDEVTGHLRRAALEAEMYQHLAAGGPGRRARWAFGWQCPQRL